MIAGPVDQRRGQLYFQCLRAFDEINHRCCSGGQPMQQLGGGVFKLAPRLDQVLVGLGIFDEGGRGADFAGEQVGGFGGKAFLRG